VPGTRPTAAVGPSPTRASHLDRVRARVMARVRVRVRVTVMIMVRVRVRVRVTDGVRVSEPPSRGGARLR